MAGTTSSDDGKRGDKMNVIVCFSGGNLDGRYDLNRSDVAPAALQFHQIAQGVVGARAMGYQVQSVGRFGPRLVVHAIAAEVLERAQVAEAMDPESPSRPWQITI